MNSFLIQYVTLQVLVLSCIMYSSSIVLNFDQNAVGFQTIIG